MKNFNDPIANTPPGSKILLFNSDGTSRGLIRAASGETLAEVVAHDPKIEEMGITAENIESFAEIVSWEKTPGNTDYSEEISVRLK